MSRVLAAVALITLATAFELGAQDSTSVLGPSARVRVWPAGRSAPYFGTLARYSADSIELETTEGRLLIPRDSVARLDLSGGVHSDARRGLKVGALVGGLAGFGLAYGLMTAFEEQGSEVLPAGAAAGAIVGGLLGLGIGALSHSERWNEVALDDPATQALLKWRDGRVIVGVAMGL